MTQAAARAPVRVDLAGGTLDLWPLYLFFPGACTVNVAISRYAECEVETIDDSVIEVELEDEDYHQRYESVREMMQDSRVALLALVAEHFKLSGIRLRTRVGVPRGSGLGASSALAVATVASLARIGGYDVERDSMVELVRDLETRLIGVPAGIQDYYPAVYGGLGTLRLDPGRVERQAIGLPLDALAPHLVLHHSGVSHFSGTNNWEIYRAVIDGNAKVRSRLERIAAAAVAMESALAAGDFVAAGAALAEEWKQRKQLARGVSTPEIEQILHVATRAGAWGGKVCGAGGGGVVVLFVDPERRSEVIDALSELPGETIDAEPVAHGLLVDSDAPRRRTEPAPVPVSADANDVEHFYAVSGAVNASALTPWLVTEIEVTWIEPRGTVHDSTRFTMAVPIDEGRPAWEKAGVISLDDLERRSELPEDESLDTRQREIAAAAVARAEDEIVEVIRERARLVVSNNIDLDLLALPGELPGDFLQRCHDEADRRFEDERQKLEATFRRRVDQVRERFELEFREIAERRAEEEGIEIEEPAIAWGQILHDIMNDRIPHTDPSDSPTEADSIAKLVQVHQLWMRERQAIDEEINRVAAHNESITLVPAEKDVVVRRPFVVWSEGPIPVTEDLLEG